MVRKMLGGIVVPLLGAGVNLAGRPEPQTSYNGPEDRYLPSGRELARFLAGAFECPKALGRTEDLLRISQYVEVMEGSGELYQRLHEVFSASYDPGPVHTFFARLQATLLEAGIAAASDDVPLARAPKPVRLKTRRMMTIDDIETAIASGRE